MKAAFWFFAFCLPILPSVITFDDLPSSGGQIRAGYAGLNWSTGFTLFDVLDYFGGPDPKAGGFLAGIVSAPSIAYNSNATSTGGTLSFFSSSPFTFNSVFLTAAWLDNLQVTVTGSLGGSPVPGDSQTVTLSVTAPTFFTFRWPDIDRVTFMPFGGTPHPGYETSTGEFFVMDNLDVATPEPSLAIPVGLALAGLLCLKLSAARLQRVPHEVGGRLRRCLNHPSND